MLSLIKKSLIELNIPTHRKKISPMSDHCKPIYEQCLQKFAEATET